MDGYMYIGFGVLILAAVIYQMVVSARQRKQALLRRIREGFGVLPECEYTADEMERIAHRFRKKEKNGYYVDDTTWNDLDMDRIFLTLNRTWSSAGEEYLYQALRFPLFSKEALEDRGKRIDFFGSHETERLEVSKEIASIGYTRKYALSQYLDNFVSLERKSPLSTRMPVLLFAASLVVALFAETAAVPLVIGVIAFNIITYFKKKAVIEPYFVCLSYLIRLAVCCETLGKKKTGCPEVDQLCEKAGKSGKSLAYLRKHIWLVGTGSRIGGGLEDILMDYVRMLFHVDVIAFYKMLHMVQKRENEIPVMLETVGELELAMAAASTRALYEPTCIPVLDRKEPGVRSVDLYHPLLEKPVANSFATDRSVLLTGSNASGKSTFLKTLALNQILAQTIYTVFAREYEGMFAYVYTSMALKDSIRRQESYYIAEIKSLKRILEAAKETEGIYCFVDEVLRGTNTVERIAASSQILSSLEKRKVLTFAATHDIELTYLLEKQYANYHFEEQIADGEVVFDYQLKEGRAVTRNAILLLSVMGYGNEIIEKAQQSAENFLKEGYWKPVE